MAELPKIACERLREQEVSDTHPDANLLSGFAEQTLMEPERAPVMEHLSRCAQCRAVVALAAPALAEQEQPAAAAPSAMPAAKAAWWRSPVVRWGTVGAVVVVVLLAVGQHNFRLPERQVASAPGIASYAPRSTDSIPAPAAAPQQPSDKALPNLPAPPAAKPSAPGMRESKKLAPQNNAADALSRAEKASSMAMSGGAGVQPQGPAMMHGPSAGTAGRPIAPSASGETEPIFEIGQSDAPMLQTGNSQMAAIPPVATTQAVTAEPALPTIANSQSEPPPTSGGIAKAKSAVAPRWSISGTGALRRSLDGARTWSEVPIASGVIFRAVSVVGKDIWVGGSGGTLFHSADGGEHWAPVHVQMDSRSLTGDIIGIEFADARHGVVSTSAGEIWRTADGSNWQLQ